MYNKMNNQHSNPKPQSILFVNLLTDNFTDASILERTSVSQAKDLALIYNIIIMTNVQGSK